MEEKKYWLSGDQLRRMVQTALDHSFEFDEGLAAVHLCLDMAAGDEREPEHYARLWRWDAETFERAFPAVRDKAVQSNAAKLDPNQLS